ncbi:NAD(P)-dependent dehydrogenase, short-chain alcohol dehydrogenase family [Brevibacterium siliguriense]|uniref:NAD(P)-dependent dehydrogenase, short-chain alcohol dehydrogenase family n=1 Tax=Brevibacterium siliguriense TaxID=1136497 RepID=A0A1H1M845_9MICO|nr:SDR family oxidoreductase [Brevibacterium siliguriense]SDR82787.1 NAD(P)-dependent dehydrogenase, short-chain alcohol dehydrogenase family [Brevibacterium siliguriense]
MNTTGTAAVSEPMGRLVGTTIMAIGCGTPDGEVNNGFAAATAFLREGAKVCIVDRDPNALDQAKKTLAEAAAQTGQTTLTGANDAVTTGAGHIGGVALDAQLTTVVADVGDDDSLAAAFAHCADRLGGPTVLHYNVGIVVNGGVDELETDGFRRALDVNLTGAFSAIKQALPHMRAAGHGSIITVSSVGGMRYMGYDYPAYAASKAGLIELTKVVGAQYASEGIRANSIAPGLIETPLIHRSISGHYDSVEDMLAARHAQSPTGKMGRPEDVADLAVFLASGESAYINSTLIPVDGGLTHYAGMPKQ